MFRLQKASDPTLLFITMSLDTSVEIDAAINFGICDLFVLTRAVLEEARSCSIH